MTPPAKRQYPEPDNALTALKLVIAQIQAAQSDNDAAMLALSQAHQYIACQLSSIAAELTNGISPLTPPPGTGPHAINTHLSRMTVAFQEHDALNQRLGHVCQGLEMLAQQLMQLKVADQDLDILENMRADYTMRSERLVFDAIVNGHEVTAEKHDQAGLEDKGEDTDIELF